MPRRSAVRTAEPDTSESSSAAGSAFLPFIDEHAVTVEACAANVWPALSRVVDRSFSGAGQTLIARALGCADLANSDPHPLAQGSTRPGFHVRTAVPPHELSLEGRHRFSRYSLSFHIEELNGNRTRLRAETRAEFPGLIGRGYRALVIGTGGHALVVHHMLAAVKHGAERPR
jgi:hypothetical protein